MKAVILAGGYGTRLSEETSIRPKPMVEIGGRPIIWHIMKLYSHHGIHDFVVCCGYRGDVLKDYFLDYVRLEADITVDIQRDEIEVHRQAREPWRVTLIDTGLNTMTGGRVRRVREHLGDETFCLTYGDGLTDVDVTDVIAFHRREGATVTLTAVQPPGRFGALLLEPGESRIEAFREKPKGDDGSEEAWINGGFFVVEPSAIDHIEGDGTVWERGPLESLARRGELAAYRHRGFWQPMDTLRDKQELEKLWESDNPPWAMWLDRS